jgi:membrane protease YdiL (CAAX protease family)
MEERPESNLEFEEPDAFKVLNQYFLLLFSLSCILSSVFIQEVFIMMKQFRVGITVAPTLGIIFPVAYLMRRFPRGIRRQLRIRLPRLLPTAYVVVATLATVVIVDNIYVFSQRFFPVPDAYIEGLKELKPDGTLAFVLTFFGLCIAVPVAEEIVFRGMIQRVFERNMPPVAAFLLAGIFFGVIHLNPQLLISMACFGIFLGFLFYATANLTYTIISHAVLNAVAFYQLVTATNDNFESSPFYMGEPWAFVGCVALVVFVLVEIKRGASKSASTPQDRFDGTNTN